MLSKSGIHRATKSFGDAAYLVIALVVVAVIATITVMTMPPTTRAWIQNYATISEIP
jgi:hypothetical protein